MQVTTVGVTGAFSLQRELQAGEEAPDTLDFGIKIATGDSPFTLTTVITIVPRYILVNKLPFSIRVSQLNRLQNIILRPEEIMNYNFKYAVKPADKKIFFGDAPGPDESLEQKLPVSRPFFAEDVADFQIPYKSDRLYTKEEPEWHDPTEGNAYNRSVRVSVTSQDDATIFIFFQTPVTPEYTIRNATMDYITVQIKGTETRLVTIDTGQTLPLLWPDPAAEKKKIDLYVGTHKGTYDITSIGKQKIIAGPPGIFYHVRNIAKTYGREITVIESGSKHVSTVRTKRQLEETKQRGVPEELKVFQRSEAREAKRDLEKEEVIYKERVESNVKQEEGVEATHSKDDLKIGAVLMGVGVSIINNEPRELIYVSLHELNAILEKRIVTDTNYQDTNYMISCNIGHIQIDNMLDKSFPVIFGPQRLFIVDSKKKVKQEDWEPFVQMKASLTETKEGNLSSTRFNSVQLQLSEMSAFVDLEILLELGKVVSSITESFKPEHAQYKHAEVVQKEIDYSPPEKVFKSLDPSSPEEPQMIGAAGHKIFIEFLHLAAIKLRVSLRLKKVAVDPTGPLVIFEVLYSVVATITNISDAPIYFTELIMQNAYTAQKDLVKSLQKHYIRQGVFQFYSILGAIDLIGNPIGLLDRLGSGVFEFFNEPRKGILKGPGEFATGIGKGVKSLITNVVGGSLNSVSRVTGSLYSLVRNVGGEKVNEDMFRKPDNVFLGTWQGVKGGAMEIATGIAGIFTKPYEGAQRGGVGGLFKGIGKGIIGAVTSPVTAALKIGTSVTQGLESTIVKIGKGGVSQQGRIRFPRYITPANVVICYDESLSEARLIIDTINDGQYTGENILLFEVLPQKRKIGNEPMVIITEKRLLVLERNRTIMMRALHRSIHHGQLYAEKDGRYVLQIILKTGKKIGFESTNYPIMAKCASYFPESKPVAIVAPRLPQPKI